MLFDRTLPYNDLPLLPPPGVDLESKAVLKQIVPTSRALAELKGAGNLIPNQAVLLSTLGLQEAKDSSQIENIVTTNDELYRAFADEDRLPDAAIKEVLHYNEALWLGFKAIRNNRLLTTNLFEELVRIIKPSVSGVRKVPNTKIVNYRGDIIYTPPVGETVIRDKLANLERFLYTQGDFDPLVKMAVMHYQFEAIHPFTDGNGRTGRILNILYLVESGLLDIPVLYLSRYIIENKNDYYRGLQSVTEEGAWEAWVLYMLRAVQQTALDTHRKLTAIRHLMYEVGEKVKVDLPSVYRKELIELLFSQPYCKISFVTKAGLGTRQTASSYLKQLERIGLLHGVKRGKEWYYINKPFFDLLTS